MLLLVATGDQHQLLRRDVRHVAVFAAPKPRVLLLDGAPLHLQLLRHRRGQFQEKGKRGEKEPG